MSIRLVYSILYSILMMEKGSMEPHCSNQPREFHRFHLFKKCHRSTQPIVGLNNTKTMAECEEFTKSVKGLAFNFSPVKQWRYSIGKRYNSANGTLFPRKSSRKHIVDQPEEFYTCHALVCPEFGNLTSLVEDYRFDYYTLYTNPLPPSNVTCIPEVGLFQLYNSKLNYSTAFSMCATQSKGALAHVMSERRTNKLALFLEDNFKENRTQERMAYVGLNYTLPDREFRTSEWESLECFAYRAWAPGYPRQHGNSSCVAIKLDRSWTTLDCSKNLPFICEVYTSGPSNEHPGTCERDITFKSDIERRVPDQY